MALRVGFDMDGVVADFASAVRHRVRSVRRRHYGPGAERTGRGKGTNAGSNHQPGSQQERDRPPSSRRLGPDSRDTGLLDDAEAYRSSRGATAARADAAVRV